MLNAEQTFRDAVNHFGFSEALKLMAGMARESCQGMSGSDQWAICQQVAATLATIAESPAVKKV